MKLARILFIMLALALPSFGQGALLPWIVTPFPSAAGITPNILGYACSLSAGTTTPAATYSDNLLTVQNANPLPLNSAGRPSSGSNEVSVYLSAISYKFIIYAPGTGNSCNGTTVGSVIRTIDNVYDIGQLIGVGAATVAIQSSTIGSLPSAGVAGRAERITNGVRGIWLDNGTNWIPQNAGVINVLDFGATGNGTTDDSAAINNALAAAAAINGKVFFPPTTVTGATPVYNQGTTTIGSQAPVSMDCARGTQFKYTGSGFAVSMGSTGGNTANYDIYGCSFLLRSDSANGLQIEQLHNWSLRNVYVEGDSSGTQTSVCLSVDGRAIDSLFGLVDGLVCNHVKVGFQPLSTGGVNTATTIVFNQFTSFGDNISGSHCVDYGASGNGDGYVFNGGNCEHNDVGISSNGGAGHSGHLSDYIGFRFEGNVTDDISLDGFSQGFRFIGSTGITNVIAPTNTSGLCNQFIANTNGSGLPYPDVQCGAGTINPLTDNTGSVGVAGQRFADVETVALNLSNAPTITTGGFTGHGINSAASTQPFVGLASSSAGGANYELGLNGSTDVHELVQSGGSGTTFTARSINPGNGINTFNAGTIGNGVAGITWSTGVGVPTGACQSGSLYTNSTGGSSTTLYVCQSSGWVAK